MSEAGDVLIRGELARLLDSDFLRRSPSHLRLLRYLVERRLANDVGALREMSIGIEVFHRYPVTYDPKSDPIVRIDVSRLREPLVKHYAMFDTLATLLFESTIGATANAQAVLSSRIVACIQTA